MRVGPIGYLEKYLRATAVLATASAECTHNSPEGIRGASAVADVIFLGRNGNSKKAIKRHIEQTYFYDLWPSYSAVQKSHKFDATCQGSVPEAIICFLEARSIEQAIDLAISLGGDADTQAMMAGSMAEAFYINVPAPMIAEVRAKLPAEMFDVIERYNKMLAS